MALCRTQTSSTLHAKSSEELAAWELSDEEREKKRVQVVYKRRKNSKRATEKTEEGLSHGHTSLHIQNGTVSSHQGRSEGSQENCSPKEGMPDWPENKAEGCSTGMANGNFTQVLDQLESINSLQCSGHFGGSNCKGIESTDMANITITIPSLSAQNSRNAPHLPKCGVQCIEVKKPQGKRSRVKSITGTQNRSRFRHTPISKKSPDWNPLQVSQRSSKLYGRCGSKHQKLIVSSEQLTRLAGILQPYNGRSQEKILSRESSWEGCNSTVKKAYGKDTIVNDDDDVPFRDLSDMNNNSAKCHRKADVGRKIRKTFESNPNGPFRLNFSQSIQNSTVRSGSPVRSIDAEPTAGTKSGCIAGMEAQRSFLLGIKKSARQSGWSGRAIPGRAQKIRKCGGLVGRLQQIIANEKAHHEEFNAMRETVKDGIPHIDLCVICTKWDGHLASAVCEVLSLSGVKSELPQRITALFHSKTSGVDTAPGTKLRVYDPWTCISTKGNEIDAVLCNFVLEL